MVCTRVQNIAGRGRLEIRVQIDLSSRERLAEAQAVQVADGVDLAVRRALATLEAPSPGGGPRGRY
jgi:hypothetical protein